jgi:hypothetical protein
MILGDKPLISEVVLSQLASGKKNLEKSRCSLKWKKSQPNDFPSRWNLTNDFLFISAVSKVIRNSRVKRRKPK